MYVFSWELMACVLSPRSRSYAFLVAVVQRVTCWMCLGGVDRSSSRRILCLVFVPTCKKVPIFFERWCFQQLSILIGLLII